MSEDITQDPEYIKGYECCYQNEKEQEERSKNPYHQGWMAAWQEICHQRTMKIEAQLVEADFDFPEDAIKQLREEVKALDERLKKLERYTQE
jgi:hypothetical protein